MTFPWVESDAGRFLSKKKTTRTDHFDSSWIVIKARVKITPVESKTTIKVSFNERLYFIFGIPSSNKRKQIFNIKLYWRIFLLVFILYKKKINYKDKSYKQ